MTPGWFVLLVTAWMVIAAIRRLSRERPRGGSGDLTPPRRPTEPARTMAQVLREIEQMRAEVGKREPGRRIQRASPVPVEGKPSRPARVIVDYDEAAAAVAQARIQQAEARDVPLDQATHQAFDEQIRQESAEAKPSGTLTVQQLRAAFVWSEILGPPGGLS
jgi:hypothetical protein